MRCAFIRCPAGDACIAERGRAPFGVRRANHVSDVIGSSERLLCMAARTFMPPCIRGSASDSAAEAGLV
jgi:hypothetical protein